VVILQVLAFLTAGLFLAGIGTPVVGVVLASIEVAFVFVSVGHLEKSVLMGAIGIATAALGPGYLSVDAKLYGRKLIEID
jgi:hypothetical protein